MIYIRDFEGEKEVGKSNNWSLQGKKGRPVPQKLMMRVCTWLHIWIYNRHRVEKSRRGPFKTVSCVENQRMKVGAINQRQGKKVECNLRII